jgi:hypothetical protein
VGNEDSDDAEHLKIKKKKKKRRKPRKPIQIDHPNKNFTFYNYDE